MTKFYEKLIKYIETKWPLSDPTYMRMFEGLSNKKVRVGFSDTALGKNRCDPCKEGRKKRKNNPHIKLPRDNNIS